ncbi:MAG: sporulation protein YabP [Oscillospiraceae bacterium]|jgi:sporulation protein YabP|nr:sporulation protein YabP [Oscillospiraceae bacterium]
MEEIRSASAMPHTLMLENRELLRLTGVSDVDSFDEQAISVFTDLGELTIRGSGLHINKLSLESGELVVEGHVDALLYADNGRQQSGGFFSKMFR